MHRLVGAFVVCMQQRQVFSQRGPYRDCVRAFMGRHMRIGYLLYRQSVKAKTSIYMGIRLVKQIELSLNCYFSLSFSSNICLGCSLRHFRVPTNGKNNFSYALMLGPVFLTHQIGISLVFNHVRYFYRTHPYQPYGKIKNEQRTLASCRLVMSL